MSNAWEVSHEDVKFVLESNKGDTSEEFVERCHNALDHDAVEKAALYGDGVQTQFQYANEEIEKQLKEQGYIS